MSIKNVEINSEYITLGQFIKVMDLVSSGGETKSFLLNTEIKINGELETRRGRKLYKNDLVIIKDKEYKIC